MQPNPISALPSDTTFINTPSSNHLQSNSKQLSRNQSSMNHNETSHIHLGRYWNEAHEHFQLPPYLTISNLFDRIWRGYQFILTFWIPIKLIKRGIPKWNTTFFKEKLVYFIHYLLSNIILAYLLIQLINNSYNFKRQFTININDLNNLSNTDNNIFVYYGNVVQLSDNQIINQLDSAIWDITFLLQSGSNQNCIIDDNVNNGPFFPKRLVKYNDTSQDIRKIKEIALEDISSTPFIPITYTFDQLYQEPYLVVLIDDVLDLTRFKYMNPSIYTKLDQDILDLFQNLNELLSILDPNDPQKLRKNTYKNRDISMTFNHFIPVTKQKAIRQCLMKELKVGRLKGPSYTNLLELLIMKWGVYAYIIVYLTGYLMIVISKVSIGDNLCWKRLKSNKDHIYRADRKLTKKQINHQIKRNQAENYLVQQTYLRQLPSFDSVNIDNLLRIEGRSPACLTFNPREFNRGLAHLAQSEPNYELEDNLDFDPLRTILLILTPSKPKIHQLTTTLESLATSRYPATHKLLTIIVDGPYHPEDKTMELLVDDVIPRHQIKYANYYSANGSISKAKVFAGYYKYMNVPKDGCSRSSLQSPYLKIPLIIIYKSQAKGKRDSMQLMLHVLNKVYFRSPLNPFEYDFFNLTRAIAGTTLDHFSLLLTTILGVHFDPMTLTNLIRPFTLNRSIMGATGNSYFGSQNDHSLGQGFSMGILSYEKWLNKLTYLTNSPINIPRHCAIYRLWAPSKIRSSLLDRPESDIPSTIDPSLRNPRPILVHPHIVSNYSQLSLLGTPFEYRKNNFGWNEFQNNWCEDEILTQLLGKEFPQMQCNWIENAKYQIITPFSLLNCCICWLQWWNWSWNGAWTIRRFGFVGKLLCLMSWLGMQFSTSLIITLMYALIKWGTFSLLGSVLIIPLCSLFSVFLNQALLDFHSQLYLFKDIIIGLGFNIIFHLIIPWIAIWNFNDITNHPALSSNIPKFSFKQKSRAILPKSTTTEINPNWPVQSPKPSVGNLTPAGSISWMDPKFTNKLSFDSWRELNEEDSPSSTPTLKFPQPNKSPFVKKGRKHNLQIRVREELFNQQIANAQSPKNSGPFELNQSIPLFSIQDWGKLTQLTVTSLDIRLSHLRSSPSPLPRRFKNVQSVESMNSFKYSLDSPSIDTIIGFKNLRNPKESYLISNSKTNENLAPIQVEYRGHQHSPSDAPTDNTLIDNSLKLYEQESSPTTIPLFIEPGSPSIIDLPMHESDDQKDSKDDIVFDKDLDYEKFKYWMSAPRPWNKEDKGKDG